MVSGVSWVLDFLGHPGKAQNTFIISITVMQLSNPAAMFMFSYYIFYQGCVCGVFLTISLAEQLIGLIVKCYLVLIIVFIRLLYKQMMYRSA